MRVVSNEVVPPQLARKQISTLQHEYASWHDEHSRWLQDLKDWQQEQNQLEALLYKLEHVLEDEEREFEALLETIENHDIMLRTHEKTIEFYLQEEQIKSDSFQAIMETHRRQKAWEEKLKDLHAHLRSLHRKVMDDLKDVIEHKPSA